MPTETASKPPKNGKDTTATAFIRTSFDPDETRQVDLTNKNLDVIDMVCRPIPAIGNQ